MTTYEFLNALTSKSLQHVCALLWEDLSHLVWLGLANQDEGEAIDYAIVSISDILQERGVQQ